MTMAKGYKYECKRPAWSMKYCNHPECEPSSKSEVCPCGAKVTDSTHVDRGPGFTHNWEPQPPVSAPEKCPICHGDGFHEEVDIDSRSITTWPCNCKADSAQPTPEGPYHWDSTGDTDWIIGPGFDMKHQPPSDCSPKALNVGFRQGQASSAKEVEVYRKALEELLSWAEKAEEQIDGEWGDCRSIEMLWNQGEMADELKNAKALLTSKPEPVAPVRKWEAEDEK